MKIYREISLGEFNAWSGGEETLRIVGEADKLNELEDLLIQDEPADGWTETALNDMLRFEDKYIFDALGINPDDYKDDEDEDQDANGEDDAEIRADIMRLLGLEPEE
jgi:hypothetical protein